MRAIDIIDGCLDGGDFSGAAAAVLCHPASKCLDRPAVSRLFRIGFCGAPVSAVDEAFLGLMATVVRIDEEAHDAASR